MAYNFKPCNREQSFLLPPSLQDWLPEDELAWFILEATEMMDLNGFYKNYRADGSGAAAYNPRMLVSLLLYSYSLGERSSRKIERLCKVDVAYRIIAGNQYPDHATLCRFRKKHLDEIEQLFIETLKLCKKAGMIKLGTTALDGTKIQGNTSLSSNKTYDRIEQEVKKMLEEADKIDREEDELYGEENNGHELPEELRTRAGRLKRLKECKEQIEREAQAEVEKVEQKIKAREAQEKETGKKARGKEPKTVDVETRKQEIKANITDPETKPMKTFHGFVQGFNGQAVATQEQIILAAELTDEQNDKRQLVPMVNAMKNNLKEINMNPKKPVCLADNGYCSEQNLKEEKELGVELIIATKQDAKQRKELGKTNLLQNQIEESESVTEKMSKKLKTKRGGTLYKKRGGIIEPIFGQIKTCLKFNRFSMRSKKACRAEWKFICTVHNLMKLWRYGNLKMA